MFNKLTSLKTLDVSQNQFDLFLEIFSLFSSLSCHGLSTIDVDLFNKLASLKTLDVSQNQLTNIPDQLKLPALQALNCAQNLLDSVTFVKNFKRLSELFFDDNELLSVSTLLHAGKFSCFFVVCCFLFQIQLFLKILSGIPSGCQIVWIQIRRDILSSLILGTNCLQRIVLPNRNMVTIIA